MKSYFFWDIENVSFHNLEKIMTIVRGVKGDIKLYTIYSKIKESRKSSLSENGWELVQTEGIGRNSADKIIIKMIESVMVTENNLPESIYLITEDKGFFKISQKIISKGIHLEVICGTKYPQWIKDLKL
jgi:hypothetical protein